MTKKKKTKNRDRSDKSPGRDQRTDIRTLEPHESRSARVREWALALLLPLGALAVFPGHSLRHNFFHYAQLPKELVLQAGVWLLLGVGLAAALRRGRIFWRRSLMGDILCVFLAWNLISMIGALNKMEAYQWLIHIALAVALFYMVSGGLGNQRGLRLASLGIGAGIVLVSVLGIMQFMSPGVPFFGETLRVPQWVMQSAPPSSTFGNRNMASQFVVMALPLAWAAYALKPDLTGLLSGGLSLLTGALLISFTTTRSANTALGLIFAAGILLAAVFFWAPILARTRGGDRSRPALNWLCFALFAAGGAAVAVGCFYSLTIRARLAWMGVIYGGMLLCVAAVGVYFLLQKLESRPRPIVMALAPTLAVALLLIMAFHRYQPRQMAPGMAPKLDAALLTDLAAVDDSTWRLRLVWWRNTAPMIAEHPVFGVGPGNFFINYALYSHRVTPDPSFTEERQIRRPHNDYLHVAAESGLVGLALLLAFGAAFAAATLRVTARGPTPGIRAAGGLLALAGAGMAVDAMANFPLFKATPPYYLLFAAGAAAWLNTLRAGTQEPEQTGPGRSNPGSLPLKHPALKLGLAVLLLAAVCCWGLIIGRRAAADYLFYGAIKAQQVAPADWEFVAEATTAAVALDPHRHDIWALAARAEKELGIAAAGDAKLERFSRSIEYAHKGLERHPFYINTLLNLGHTLNLKALHIRQSMSGGKSFPRYMELQEEALDQYQQALAVHPLYAKAQSNRAYTMLELDRYWSGRSESLKVVRIDDEFARGWYNLGNAHHGMAQEYAFLAMSWRGTGGPGPVTAPEDELGAAVFSAMAAWSYARADYAYTRAFNLEPAFTQSLLNRSMVRFQAGAIDEGIDDLRRLKAAGRDQGSLAAAVTDVTERIQIRQPPEQAAQTLKRLIQILPNDSRLYFYLGNAYRHLEDRIPARDAYRRAVELDPGFALTRNNYANMLQLGGEYDEAVEQYLAAIEINENFPDAWKNLGVLYMNTGRIELAIQAFNRTLELNPNQPQADMLRRHVQQLAAQGEAAGL